MTKTQAQQLNVIFAELASRCDTEGYTFATYEDLDRWSRLLDMPWLEALDRIGVELAQRYHRGLVDYHFGDSLANDLWAEMITRHQQIPDGQWPAQFDEVYVAFDAGEFRRERDGDADPVKLYTDPAIVEFLAKLA